MSRPDETTAATPVMSERRVALIGSLFVAIGPISMALYTPAMTEVVRAFETTEGLVKLSLTLYFAGFACAQLVAGPLSDALGRRPVTLAFMAIYCAGSVAALAAPGIEMLLVARFIQGIGASAGVAISRAIVRDLYTGNKSSAIMNLIGIILAIGPAAAPTIGGLTLALAGWRMIFALMVILGLAVMLTTLVALRETVVPDRNRLNFRALGRSYWQVLHSRHFLGAAGVMSGALGALYAQATFLPFILMDEVGLTPMQFGLGMLMQSGFFFLGSIAFRRAMRRRPAEELLLPGLAFIAAGSLGTAGLLVWDATFLRVMVPVAIYAIGIAFVMPSMTTSALLPFPKSAGAAAAMLGFLQMGAGLVIGTIGASFGDAQLAMGLLIPAMGATAILSYLFYRQTARRARAETAAPATRPEPARDEPRPPRTPLPLSRCAALRQCGGGSQQAREEALPDEILLREDTGAIATLTLNNPGKLNALSDAMLGALQAEFDALARDQAIRVVILRAAGKAFCAGHDLREMTQARQAEDGGRASFERLFDTCARMMMSIVNLPQPVIAEVHGIATAAGCQLVATCDLAVAAEGTRFGVNGVNIGLFCSTPMVALTRNIPPKRAFEMLTTGGFIEAEEAARLGLVNRVVPEADLHSETRALAATIAGKLGPVVRIGKRAFYEQAGMGLSEAYAHTGAVMAANMMREDTAEGIDAFLSKRKPSWAT